MYEAIVAVRNSTLDPVRRVIAEEYAYYTVPETQEASASIGYIANCTNVCERTVRAVTKELCDMGFLEKVGVNKKFGNVVYRVHCDTLPKREPYKYNLRGRPPKVYDGSAEKTPAPDAPLYLETPAPDAPVANKTPANGAYITEYTLKSKQEAEAISFRNSVELENPSSDTPPEIVSPLSVSELEPALQNSNGVMSTGYVEQVVTPEWATLVAEELPAEPVTVKSKPKKAAAKPKAPKVVKPPKEPREMSERDLAFLERIAQLNPLIAPDVEKRLGMYRRSNPWSVTQIFLLTGIWPNKNNWNAITSLNGEAFDTEKLVSCLSAWTAKGWSPKNLDWVFNWYKAGGPPQYIKYGQQPTAVQPTPVPSKPKIEFDDPLVIGSTQWVMANPMYSTMSPRSIQLGIWAAMNDDEMYMFHLAEAPKLIAEHLAEKSAMKGKK